MGTSPTFEEYLAVNGVLHEWADCYDSKDWQRLTKCIAPTLRVDYRETINQLWEAMPADEFVAMISRPNLLGNPLLKTQHLIGASRWEKVSDDEIVGYHQIRAAHQRYADETKKSVAAKGHAHSANTHWYRRVDGEWKFAGLSIRVLFTEHDFHALFQVGAKELADEAGA